MAKLFLAFWKTTYSDTAQFSVRAATAEEAAAERSILNPTLENLATLYRLIFSPNGIFLPAAAVFQIPFGDDIVDVCSSGDLQSGNSAR